ncbi:MAG: GntP family permease [Cyclobacteriaceae bacterium]|nr:GntP family permease [Cyclobacteriaceae bacterium]
MQEPLWLMILLMLTITFIVWSGVQWKWHPVFSLLIACFGFGLLSGQPISSLITTITTGFGALLGGIGLIVVLGSMLGAVLEDAGAVKTLGNALYKRAGKHPSLSMALLGMVLGIPVFCDSGFMVLVSLSRSLASVTHTPAATMNLSLAGGLYTTHTLVPPTPGPVAAAANLGVTDSLGLIILLGMLVSVPVIITVFFYSRWVGNRITVTDGHPILADGDEPNIRSLRQSILLLVLPVVLIAIASLVSLFELDFYGRTLVLFIGSPVVALLLTVVTGIALFQHQFTPRQSIEKGIVQAGPVLLLTGCGGALGAVLKASHLTAILHAWTADQALTGFGFLLTGFIVAAVLKTAQGSSTSALVIVSTMMAPLAQAAGMQGAVELSLLVLAIGAGAMTVSHANDSYFWVVSSFSGLDLNAAYRGITVMTLLQGFTALITILLLYSVLP